MKVLRTNIYESVTIQMNNGNLWFGTSNSKERGYSMSGSFIDMLIASLSLRWRRSVTMEDNVLGSDIFLCIGIYSRLTAAVIKGLHHNQLEWCFRKQQQCLSLYGTQSITLSPKMILWSFRNLVHYLVRWKIISIKQIISARDYCLGQPYHLCTNYWYNIMEPQFGVQNCILVKFDNCT